MSKIVISESELEKIVYESTISVINEGKWGKVALKGLGNVATLAALGPGALALKGYYNMKNKNSMADMMFQKSANSNGLKNNEKAKEPKEKLEKDTYGKHQVYNENNLPIYCNNFKYKNVIVGHGKSKDDESEDSQLAKFVKDVRKSEEERRDLIKKFLTDRDKSWGIIKESINEIPIKPAIKAGVAALKMRRRFKKSGLGNNRKNTLLNYNEKYNMIEKEILPVVLNNLCAVLSIEKEDPMYQLITNPQTKEKMMKLIAKEIK